MARCVSCGAGRFNSIRQFLLFLVVVAVGLAGACASFGQTTAVWIGGTDNWSNSAAWNPATVPSGDLFDVYVDNGNTGVNSVVSVNGAFTVGRLTIDSGDTVGLNNGQELIVNNSGFTGAGVLDVNGALNLNSAGNSTELIIEGATSLNGTGTVTLSNNINNYIFANNDTDRLTVASTMTIQGAGQIGDGFMSLTNNGTIDANVSNALYLQPVTSGDFTNNVNAIWEATAGGTLVFKAGTFNNGGTIESIGTNGQMTPTASQVDFNGSSITGGIITTSTGGVATVTSNSSFSGITNNGTIGVNNGQTMTVSGTITNNGTIALNSSGNGTNLWISGPVSLAGTGFVTMSNNTNNTIEAANNTDRLTVGSSMTIQGAGQIGDGDMSMTNNGTIDANNTQPLILQPNSTGDFTNSTNAVMEATAGGTLQLNGGTFTNNGTIEAVGASSTVLFHGSSITGGIITTSTGGAATVSSNSSFSGITNSGTIGVNNGQTMTVSGTITNNGTIAVNSTGNGTNFWISGPVSLAGTGFVTMGNNINNTIEAANDTDRLTVGSSMTIQGAGLIGDGDMSMTNNGTIDANSDGRTLTLQPNSTGDFTNGATGTWEATNGGILVFVSGPFTNNNIIQSVGTDGQSSPTASQVQFDGSSITGGTINTSGGGTATVTSNSSFSGITNSGTIGVNNGQRMTISGTITNNGTIQLNSGGNSTDLVISGPVALNGTGSVTLGSNINNRIYAANNSDILTLGANETIQGDGQIGVASMSLMSAGTIDANVNGGTLTIEPNAPGAMNTPPGFASNSGTWEASNGGILLLQGGGGSFSSSGTLEALTGSEVRLSGGASISGTLTTTGTGFIHNTNSATLTNVTNNGTFTQDNGAITTLVGTITNNGTIQLNSGGNHTDLVISGAVTLNGNGAVTLGNNINNRIYAANNSDILTLGANETIQGEGQLGVASMSLMSAGTIDANVNGGTLTIEPNAPGAMNTPPGFASNSGTWEASNGGILILAGGGGSFSSTGTLEALNASEVRLSGGASISGTLTTTGTGFIHNTDLATLSNVTNNGTFTQDNGAITTLVGTITNNGTIQLNSGGNHTDLVIGGAVTLNGTGTVTFSNNVNNRIYAANNSDRLTVGASQTIQGAGLIGVGDMAMTNNGTIDANDSQPMTLQPNGSLDFTNGATGIIEATAGGTLILVGGPFDNNNVIQAVGTSSAVQFDGSAITGGTITTSTGGTATVTANSSFSGITNTGTIGVNNGQTMTLSGTITNNGTIQLNSSGNDTNVAISGPTTIAGAGAVMLGANVNNRIYAANNIDTLTVGQNQTIEGEGQLGVTSMALSNNGTVNANISTATLIMSPNATGFTNNATGLWEASNGGTLRLQAGGGSFTNNGTIQANNNSTVTMDPTAVLTNNSGGTLSGGTYAAVSIASAAVVNLSGGNVTNNAATVTLSGALASIPVIDTISANQSAGTFNLLGGQSFTTLGALSNAGTVDVGPSSTLTILAGTSYTQTAGTTIVDGTLTTTLTGGQHFTGGILKGTGTLTGNVSVSGSANVEPGDSPGTLNISGTYSQVSPSVLDILLASPSSFSVLDVTGTASIGGTLDVFQYNGFVPTVTETFDILHSGALTGTFGSTNSNPGGIAYTVQYTPTDAIITITRVPEPSMLGLLSLGAMGLLRRRKSKG